MGEYRKLWWTLILILIVTFTILGFSGREIYQNAPPIPSVVTTTSNQAQVTVDRATPLRPHPATTGPGNVSGQRLWGTPGTCQS